MIEAIVVAVITAFSGVIGYAIKARSDKSATTSADWQSFSAEMREWTERRLAERDESIAALRAEVEGMRSELSRLADRYTSAIRYVEQLWHDNTTVPPADIADDLPTPPWER